MVLVSPLFFGASRLLILVKCAQKMILFGIGKFLRKGKLCLWNLDLFQVNFLVFTRHVPKTSAKIFVEVPPWLRGPLLFVLPYGTRKSSLFWCAKVYVSCQMCSFFLFLGLGSVGRLVVLLVILLYLQKTRFFTFFIFYHKMLFFLSTKKNIREFLYLSKFKKQCFYSKYKKSLMFFFILRKSRFLKHHFFEFFKNRVLEHSWTLFF